MPPQFRCVGRVYPNAPERAHVGQCGRVGPRVFVAFWNFGTGAAALLNGVNSMFYYAGTPTLGWNPRVNWNADPGPLAGLNLSIQGSSTDGFYMQLDIGFYRFDMSVGHEYFRTDPNRDCFSWPEDDVLFLPYLLTIGGPRLVFDGAVQVNYGTYGRIPANSCLGA